MVRFVAGVLTGASLAAVVHRLVVSGDREDRDDALTALRREQAAHAVTKRLLARCLPAQVDAVAALDTRSPR